MHACWCVSVRAIIIICYVKIECFAFFTLPWIVCLLQFSSSFILHLSLLCWKFRHYVTRKNGWWLDMLDFRTVCCSQQSNQSAIHCSSQWHRSLHQHHHHQPTSHHHRQVECNFQLLIVCACAKHFWYIPQFFAHAHFTTLRLYYIVYFCWWTEIALNARVFVKCTVYSNKPTEYQMHILYVDYKHAENPHTRTHTHSQHCTLYIWVHKMNGRKVARLSF